MCSACFDDFFFSCFSSTFLYFSSLLNEQSQNLLADLGRCAEKFLKEASRYGEVSLHDALRPAFVLLHISRSVMVVIKSCLPLVFVSKFGGWTVKERLGELYQTTNLEIGFSK